MYASKVEGLVRAPRTIGFALVLFVFPRVASGATINITPADSHDKIESARAGDEVIIAPGTYRFRVYLTQTAPANAPIVIRAQDPSNPPVWDLTGTLVENAPEATPQATAGADAGS